MQTIHATQKKRRGRSPKPEGWRVSIPVAFTPDMVMDLDACAGRAEIARSEAVRGLVGLGLRAKGKAR
jgi:hypothetical protein